MDEKQIEEFRQQLIQVRSELEAISGTSDDAAKPVILDQTSVGRLSRMGAMQAQSMAIETKERRENQLLRRIDAATYGECLSCGEDIDVRRLGVDPSYTQCIYCAGKH